MRVGVVGANGQGLRVGSYKVGMVGANGQGLRVGIYKNLVSEIFWFMCVNHFSLSCRCCMLFMRCGNG